MFPVADNAPQTLQGYQAMRAPKRAKKQLLSDIYKMDEGQLGLSTAQKEQTAQSAQQAAAAQAGAQQAQARRADMAAGAGFSGYSAQAQRDLGTGAQEQAAKSRAQSDAMSAQLEQTQAAEIKGRLERQQERARDNARYWAQFAIDANESMASIAAMGAEIYGDAMGGGMGGGGGG